MQISNEESVKANSVRNCRILLVGLIVFVMEYWGNYTLLAFRPVYSCQIVVRRGVSCTLCKVFHISLGAGITS